MNTARVYEGMPQGDANTTDPMVGTLAEGGVIARDGHDPFERMPPPHAKPPSLTPAEPTGAAEISVELSDSWEPPTWPLPQRAGPPANHPSEAAALGSPAASESLTTLVRAEVREDRAPDALHALDTPMTGASGPDAQPRTREKSTVGRMAFGLAGAGAVVLLLVSARFARSSREPTTRGVQIVDSRGSGAAPAVSDLEFGARPPRSIAEAVDAPRAPADSVVPPKFAAPAEPAVAKTNGRSDAGSGGAVVRRATLPPRPALRSPSAKVSVPDDGRDELYVPAEAR